MTETINKRQTAYAFWISDIRSAQVDETQQFPSFNIREKNTFRVNLIAIITSKYVSENGSYASIELDDGTGAIQAKAWNEDSILIMRQEVGNVVLAIGKLGLNNSKEVYVRPEIIRQIEMPWLLARKKELETKYDKPNAEQPRAAETIPETLVIEEAVLPASKFAVRSKILELLNGNLDGLEENKLAEMSGYEKNDAMKAINELVREGEIFYVRPGVLKGL